MGAVLSLTLWLASGNLFHILDCLAQLEWGQGGGTMTWSHCNLQLNMPCCVDTHIPTGQRGGGGEGCKDQWIYWIEENKKEMQRNK